MNGAEILIGSEMDVEFEADGMAVPVTEVVRSSIGEQVKFISGIPAASPLENKIRFRVKAPSRPFEQFHERIASF